MPVLFCLQNMVVLVQIANAENDIMSYIIWVDNPVSSDMDVMLLPQAAGLSPYFL